MIQITNDDLQYIYNCLYPCGEDDIKIVVDNDLRSDVPQIGLSISQNSLTFIKDDAEEVRTLIDSGYDYKVSVNNLMLFQLDFANYEDDGVFVNVPLISSSVKDFLQNTTLETLGISKFFNAHFLKKPDYWLNFSVDDDVYFRMSGATKSVSISELVSGNLPPNIKLVTTNSGLSYLQKDVPIASAITTGSSYNGKWSGNIFLQTSGTTSRNVTFQVVTQLIGVLDDDTKVTFNTTTRTSTYTVTENVDTSFSNAVVLGLTNWKTCQDEYNGHSVVSAYQTFKLRLYIYGSSPFYEITAIIRSYFEIHGNFVDIDYTLPAITTNSIQQVLTSKGLNIGIIPSSNYYFITSPNVDKLNNTKLIEIVSFFAKMQGKILHFSYDGCAGVPYDYIFGLPVVPASTRCNVVKKGFTLDYSYKIGGNPSILRLANVPEGMWANTYSTTQKSNILAQKNISMPEIISDGAEILNILISNDQQSFIIDNSNSNIESNDDTPLNYNFAACMIVKNNIVRMVSNSQDGVNSYSPDDTAGVVYTIPYSSGVTTSQPITFSSAQDRLAPYTEEFDIPMTSAMISYILSTGYFIRLNVDGQDFCVESCEFGANPSQVHIIGRKVI